ncbi:hypothetical protein AX16_010767 [Volvariella volvacea WC 439]|nr:hypothetical protein AX16_010767 [Volvariella volvacea WC 439]
MSTIAATQAIQNTDSAPCPFTTLADGTVRTCSYNIDYVIKSSDGIFFGAHSAILLMHSDNMVPVPPPGYDPTSDPKPNSETLHEITLPEHSEELSLLLGFMHPGPLPNIQDKRIPLEVVVNLIKAAEKYRVYAAIEMCKVTMRMRVKENPFLVLSCATTYGYTDLGDIAANLTIFSSVEDAVRGISNDKAFRAWSLWHYPFKQIQELLKRTNSNIGNSALRALLRSNYDEETINGVQRALAANKISYQDKLRVHKKIEAIINIGMERAMHGQACGDLDSFKWKMIEMLLIDESKRKLSDFL